MEGSGVVREEVVRGVPGRRKNGSTGVQVGNMRNKSHEALDKCKVLTGYHFYSSIDLIFSLQGSPLMFILTCFVPT